MDALEIRYEACIKSLAALESSLAKFHSDEFIAVRTELRDSTIQRLEFSSDTLWKLMRLYLEHVLKIKVETISPRYVFRKCADAQIISLEDFEIFISMVADRNLTSHTYSLVKTICPI